MRTPEYLHALAELDVLAGCSRAELEAAASLLTPLTIPAGETLAAAPPAATSVNLAEQAKQQYDRAIQAQRDGDWARYGEEIKRLGATIEQMAKQP